jgi:hypothetical protein
MQLHQDGSGYVPSDFQAHKSYIPVPGQVFVKGRRPRLLHRLNPGLEMAAKAERRSASHPACQIQLWRTFFCLREVKSELADLRQSHGGLTMNLDGVVRYISKNGPAADFWR